MNAPLTKPVPLAVMVNPCPPTGQIVGLTNDRVEEDVWMLRFVLYCEQADASPQSNNAQLRHIWEPIRTCSLSWQAPSGARARSWQAPSTARTRRDARWET